MQRKKIITIVIIIVLAAAGGVSYFLLKNPEIKNKLTFKKNYYCPICGIKTTSENVDKKPLAVMVENMSIIRPQSGLSKACIVYEALAEGGITRFLAIYGGHKNAKIIGPVRSARPYYVDIAAGFNPVYAHAGGSTKGLDRIKTTGIDDLSEFTYSSSYWRDNSRSAPHNLFTSTDKLREGIVKAGYEETAEYTGFEFNHKRVKNKRKSMVIGIDFSLDSYYSSYQYNPKTNSYDRYNAHVLQKDAINNEVISPKNVIIMKARTSTDIGETLDIDVIGEGIALYFMNGKVISGKWEKSSSDEQIKFLDSKSKDIELNPGQTWVELVKTDTPVTY